MSRLPAASTFLGALVVAHAGISLAFAGRWSWRETVGATLIAGVTIVAWEAIARVEGWR